MIWVVVIAGSAIAPSAFLLWYIYSRDLHPEPKGMIAATFGLGAAIAIPVLIFVYALNAAVAVPTGVWSKATYTAFMNAAIPEEGFKLLVLMTFCWFSRHFDEPFDGIVYGATASLGFATLENVLYVSQGGLVVAVLRALTAVPGHAFCGVVMGYFVGRAKFARTGRTSLVLQGFAYATLLHGFYDLFLMTGTVYAFLALPVLVGEIVLGVLLIRRMRTDGFIPAIPLDAQGKPIPVAPQPAYGYPPYGYPPYGYPPYGYPPYGYSPYGYPPHGSAPYASPATATAPPTSAAPAAPPLPTSAPPVAAYAPPPAPPVQSPEQLYVVPPPRAWPQLAQRGQLPPWPAPPAAVPTSPDRGAGAANVLKLVFGGIIGSIGALFGLALIGVVAREGLPGGHVAAGAVVALAALGLGSLIALIGGILLFRWGLKGR